MTRSRALSRLRRDVRRGTREMPMDQGPDIASDAPNPDEFGAAEVAESACLLLVLSARGRLV